VAALLTAAAATGVPIKPKRAGIEDVEEEEKEVVFCCILSHKDH